MFSRGARMVLMTGLMLVAGAAPASAGDLFLVAGSGGALGDGGPATAAQLNAPQGIALTPDGGFVVADRNNNRVRRVAPDGTITTIAGDGTDCTPATAACGDGGPATSAQVGPGDVAVTAEGGVLVTDGNGARIRYVSSYTGGTITTVAGTGTKGFAGDGGPATAAQLSAPKGLAVLPGGGFLFTDTCNHRVRLVSAVIGGTISTVAGSGPTTDCLADSAFSGDNGPAAAARFSVLQGVALLPDGGFLVSDRDNNRIRKVSAVTGGTVTTVAGSGTAGYAGDGGAATAARLNGPDGVQPTPDGGFVFADENNFVFRRVNPSGRITTIAGGGSVASPPNGTPGTMAQFGGFPYGLMPTADGGLLLADRNGARIYSLDVDLRPGPAGPPGAAGP